jgi:hypothetical protein
MKKVRCIDDSMCGNKLKKGQIYEVVAELDSSGTLDGKQRYELKGVSNTPYGRWWWASRFEVVDDDTPTTVVETPPAETVPAPAPVPTPTESFDFQTYNYGKRQ